MKQFFQSIRFKVAAGLSVVVIAALGSFAYWSITEASKTLEAETVQKHKIIVESNLPSLADSLWNMAPQLTEKVIGSMFTNGQGTDAVVINDSNEVHSLGMRKEGKTSILTELGLDVEGDHEHSSYLKSTLPKKLASEEQKIIIEKAPNGRYYDISALLEYSEEGETQAVGILFFRFSTEKLTAFKEKETRRVLVSTLILTTLIIVITLIFLNNQVIQPIKKVSAASSEVASGHFVKSPERKSHDEIGELSRHFNQMVSNIEENTQRLNKMVDWGTKIASQNELSDLYETIKTAVQDFQTSPKPPNLILRHDCIAEGLAEGYYLNLNTESGHMIEPPKAEQSLLIDLKHRPESKSMGFISVDDLSHTEQESLGTVLKVLSINVVSSINSILLKRTMEKVKLQTQEIQTIMENISQGICMFDQSFEIGNTYSSALATMFQLKKGGDNNVKNFLLGRSDLSQAKRDETISGLDMSFDAEIFSYEANSHVLPRETIIDQKVYELDWTPILNTDEEVSRVMVTVRDVTELRQLEQESQKFQREMKMINQLVNIPPLVFEQFQSKAHKYITHTKEVLGQSTRDLEAFDEIKRYLHTFKGDSRILKFDDLGDVVHETETLFIEYTDVPDEKPQLKSEVIKAIDRAKEILEEYKDIQYDKLNRSAEDESVRIKNISEYINHLFNLSRDASIPPKNQRSIFELTNGLMNNSFETFKKTLDSYKESILSLCEELGKPTPTIKIDIDNNIVFDPYCLEELKVCLTHMTRNTVDHGFSDNEPGYLHIEVAPRDDFVEIIYDTNDSGLDFERLKEKAKRLEIQWKHPEDLGDMIFVSGVSTKEQVTRLSGRGIGMDAVKKSIEALGGTICIEYKGKPTPETKLAPFLFRIKIPEHHVEVSTGPTVSPRHLAS